MDADLRKALEQIKDTQAVILAKIEWLEKVVKGLGFADKARIRRFPGEA